MPQKSTHWKDDMGIYLSRLYLNTLHRDIRVQLGNCYRMHQKILSAFPDVNGGDKGRNALGVLYRIETVEKSSDTIRLLVQSAMEPNWRVYPSSSLKDYDNQQNPSVRRVDSLYYRIGVGMQLLFRLRANPTKRLRSNVVGQEDKLSGKRVALLRESEQVAWLARKGEQHGFRLLGADGNPEMLSVQVAKQEESWGWYRRDSGTGDVSEHLNFGAVVFSGLLEVTHQEQFQTALVNGIGSGKAFGFGLLSIAQVR
mgnify:CR=1 FL=1